MKIIMTEILIVAKAHREKRRQNYQRNSDRYEYRNNSPHPNKSNYYRDNSYMTEILIDKMTGSIEVRIETDLTRGTEITREYKL